MMKAKLIFLLKYYLFWVVISIVAKIMFLFYQWSDTTHLSAADFWHILAGGIRLDLSLSNPDLFGLRRGKDYPGRICRFDAVVTSLFLGSCCGRSGII